MPEIDSNATHSTMAAVSMAVARNITTNSANTMFTAMPMIKVGMASARLGHMRWAISAPIMRPSSERPKSNTNKRTDFSKRSEEHTSELQSRENLVCRLLLEKKKKLSDTILDVR